MIIKLCILECLRCNHKWTPRKIDVRICPKCKSAFWDKKRGNEKEQEKKDNSAS